MDVDEEGRFAVLFCPEHQGGNLDPPPKMLRCGWFDGDKWNVAVVDPMDKKPRLAEVVLRDGMPHVIYARNVEPYRD